MEYTINGSTVFIKANKLVSQFKVEGDIVSRVVLAQGDEFFFEFHRLGDLPLNTESILLNQLRKEAKI